MGARLNLTRRQAEVIDVITDYTEEHGYSPTLEEIGEILEVNRVTIFEHVKVLQRKGWLRTRKHCSRSIELLDESEATPGIRVLGCIAAGHPIEAVEQRETFQITEFFPTDRDCYMLRVSGNSMIEDQIRDGDYVLVEARPKARAGETVVALIDEESATLKRFYPTGKRIRLEPRNSKLKPLVVDANRVRIQGVVIGVLRRY